MVALGCSFDARVDGLIKNRHGTYYSQQRVPERLQRAVVRVLKSSRPRQVSLKKTLGTKVLAEANSRAKPVLMEFDRTLPPLRLLRAQGA
ncbi:DUF6538 domain-containing protein [Bradyrhizobium sp. CCGB12]|uniref:DUF6538 domain-containing protein n=1 Tax=Bradyrhizobium sp. CCGB12 TaxID=2949632 RepID=UPI0035BF641A